VLNKTKGVLYETLNDCGFDTCDGNVQPDVRSGRGNQGKPAATGLERAEQVANPKGVSQGIDTAEAKQAQHKTKKSKKSKKNAKSKSKAGSK